MRGLGDTFPCACRKAAFSRYCAVLGTPEDTTERQRVEESLRASEGRFRALFDHSPDALFLTEPDGRVKAANPAACAMFGMTEDELCRAGRAGIVAPDDPRLAAALAERRTGYATNVELSFVRRTARASSAK